MAKSSGPKLHEVAPRESAGRDTVSRFESQFRAAAYEALGILDDKAFMIFCDYHDDYVTQFKESDEDIYKFTQVKTKSKLNHQWSVSEIAGVSRKKTQDTKKIQKSFLFKLIINALIFKDRCTEICFMTNIHLKEETETLLQDLSDWNLANKKVKHFVQVLGIEYSDQQICESLKKLKAKPGVSYICPKFTDFIALAREQIFKYSEIDLSRAECDQIIKALLALVKAKSSGVALSNLTEEELVDFSGVGIRDLLGILSISPDAYFTLKDGGDLQAVKTASIINRKIVDAGGSEDMALFCSRTKVKWDKWCRESRHTHTEMRMKALESEIQSIYKPFRGRAIEIHELQVKIEEVTAKVSSYPGMDEDLVFGGFISVIVKDIS